MIEGKKTVADYPKLVEQWDWEKNGDNKPEDFTFGSDKKIFWKCNKGSDHEWQVAIGNRTGDRPSGCPYCANQKLSITNSFATIMPNIAKEWHPTKNGTLLPTSIIAGTNKKYWWKCPKGPDHEWPSTLDNRTRGGKGCPFCRGFKASVTNSLAAQYPEIAKEWHTSKNGGLAPDQIVAGSNKKYCWKCPEGPERALR